MGLLDRRRGSLPLTLDVKLEGDLLGSKLEGSSLTLPPLTPIFAAFSSAPVDLPPRPVLVASVPRAARLQDLASARSSPPSGARMVIAANSLAFPASSTPSPSPSPTPPSAPPADGPLTRAILANNERRCKTLRASLKQFSKAATESITTLQENATAQAAVDDSLSALSSSASASEVLSRLYSSALRGKRGELRERSRREIEELRGLVERVREAMDRLKSVEHKKRSFEADSKKHYDELSKVSHCSRVYILPCAR